MSVEALLGTEVAYAEAYQAARPHPGQVAVAAELRHLLRDSTLQQHHHGSAHKVQDPYSLRCIPQVHGAVRDALDQLRRILEIELNDFFRLQPDRQSVCLQYGAGKDRMRNFPKLNDDLRSARRQPFARA